jgi:formate hydrogenlyase subunit 3/multisubunit Na+/H+ antiporter MnhD subunit
MPFIPKTKLSIMMIFNRDRHFWLMFALFLYGMALFIAGGDFFALKIIREITEIEVYFSIFGYKRSKQALKNVK